MSRDKDVRTCVRHIVGVAPHDHIHFAQVSNDVNCVRMILPIQFGSYDGLHQIINLSYGNTPNMLYGLQSQEEDE